MANLKTKIKETASQDFLKIYSDFQLHYLFFEEYTENSNYLF